MDYSKILQNLEDKELVAKVTLGEDKYNNLKNYISLKSNTEQFKDTDLFPSAEIYGNIMLKYDDTRKQLGKEKADLLLNHYGSKYQQEYNNVYNIYNNVKGDFAYQPFAEITDMSQFEYTDSDEDKIRQSMGLVPSTFSISKAVQEYIPEGYQISDDITPDQFKHLMNDIEKHNTIGTFSLPEGTPYIDENGETKYATAGEVFQGGGQIKLEDVPFIQRQTAKEQATQNAAQSIKSYYTDQRYNLDSLIQNALQDPQFEKVADQGNNVKSRGAAGITESYKQAYEKGYVAADTLHLQIADYYLEMGNSEAAKAVRNYNTTMKALAEAEKYELDQAPKYVEEHYRIQELENIEDQKLDEISKEYTLRLTSQLWSEKKPLVEMTAEEIRKCPDLDIWDNVEGMTPNQIKVYAYHMATDKKLGKEYAEAIKRQTSDVITQRQQENMQKEGETTWGKIGLAAKSLPTKMLAGVTNLGAGLDFITRDSKLPDNPNAWYTAPSSYTSNAREIATQDMGETAKFLTHTGLSIADYALAYLSTGGAGGVATTGGKILTTGVMASEAAGMTTYDVLQRGGTTGEAWLTGFVTGCVEGATEYIVLGKLDKAIKSISALKATGATKLEITKQWVKNTLFQGVSEGVEESIAEIANTIVDISINGKNSAYELYIKELMNGGKTETEARQLAGLKFFGENVMLASIGGFLSGGAIGGGAQAVQLVQTSSDVQAAHALIEDIDAKLSKNPSEGVAKELTEMKEVLQTALDAAEQGNAEGMAQPLSEMELAEQEFVFEELESVARPYDMVTETDIARENIGTVTEAIHDLGKIGNIKIDQNATLAETINTLAQTRAELQNRLQNLKDLDIPSITVKNLLPSEIRNIGKAIADRTNTATGLKHAITDISSRIRKTQSKARSELVTKLRKGMKVKGTREFKTLIDSLADTFDTKTKSITDKTKAELERLKAVAIATYTDQGLEIPQSVLQTFERLNQKRVNELSEDEIDTLNTLIDMARHDSDVETKQAKTIKGQTIQQGADNIKSGKPQSLPKNNVARRATNYVKSPLSRAHTLGQAFTDTLITPVLEGTRTKGQHNYWVDTNAMDTLNKMFQKEFGDKKVSKNSEKINDSNIGEHTRAELLAIYATAKDSNGFEALHDKGYDRVKLQKFVKSFEQTYPELYKGYELIRKVLDYYAPLTNDAHRHINGVDYITEKMQRDNPTYYPLSKEGTYFTAPTVEGKTGNKITPTFTNQRVGGGELFLANPLWVIKNYANQANRYVSFAPAIYDASNLLNTEQLHNIFDDMGRDQSNNIIEEKYWQDWLTRVAKGNPGVDKVASKIRSKIAGATLSMSPTIPLKQVASFYGAVKYIDPKHLYNPDIWRKAAQTLLTKQGRAELYQAEPLLYDRIHSGQSSIELGDLSGRLFRARAVRGMDALTVTAIYHAAQAQAEGTNAQKLFQQALWETQPMYDVAFRSGLQNSETGRWLLMFSTQQYQQQNMIRQAMTDVKQKNYSRAARALTGVTMNIAAFGALSWVLFKFLYKRDDDENNLLEQIGLSALGTASPLASRFFSNYGINSVVIDTYNDIKHGFEIAVKKLKGGDTDYTIYGTMMKFADPLAKAFGIPLENTEKWFGRIADMVIPEFDYKDWKKHENVLDKVNEYVKGESSQYPEELPNNKGQLNQLYFNITNGGEGDLERLLELYSEYDKGYGQNVKDLLKSIKSKIENQFKQDETLYTEEDVEAELEKYVEGVLNFFNNPLDLENTVEAELFSFYKETGNDLFLLDDKIFRRKGQEFEYPVGWEEKVLDELEKTLENPDFELLNLEEQTDEIEEDILAAKKSIEDNVISNTPYDYLEKIQNGVTGFDIKEVAGWEDFDIQSDVISALDELDITPKNPQTLNGEPVTDDQRQRLADLTFGMLDDLDNYSKYYVNETMETAFDVWKAYQIPGWDKYNFDDPVIDSLIDLGVKPINAQRYNGSDLTTAQKTSLAEYTYQKLQSTVWKTADEAHQIITNARKEWEKIQ